MRLKAKSGILVVLIVTTSMVSADTLELKNGSQIKGKFLGGSATEISFQVGSVLQKYSVADIVSLRFDSEGVASGTVLQPRDAIPDNPIPTAATENRRPNVTIPAGTRIFVRTIDAIDSSTSRVGDRFLASLEEPLTVGGDIIVPQDALVYGRLTELKQPGAFTGKSQLRLELISIAVNGKMVPLVTGEYEATGKSRGASTAKRTIGGAALGAMIGAAADGGQGAAIGAGVGAGAGATSEIIIGGDHVKVPSESLLDFTLQVDASVPRADN